MNLYYNIYEKYVDCIIQIPCSFISCCYHNMCEGIREILQIARVETTQRYPAIAGHHVHVARGQLVALLTCQT